MKATKEAPGTVEKLLRGFSFTKEGRQAVAAAEAADARVEERRAARAKLDEVARREVEIPPLIAKMREAEERLAEETERLRRELFEARRAHHELAGTLSAWRGLAENTLTRTVDPLLYRAKWALMDAIAHVSTFTGGVGFDQDRRLLATAKTTPPRSNEVELFANLTHRVSLANRALEILPGLEEALDRIEDMAFEVEVDPSEVRTILKKCPQLDPNNKPLNLLAALDDVPVAAVR